MNMSNPDLPNFPAFLNTGDSDAIRKDLLEKTVKYLVSEYHFKVINHFEDLVGTYTYVMRDTYSQRFYIIAKGSKLMGETISCQAGLPNLAIPEHSPIILVWFNPENKELKFYVFDPESILRLVKEHPEKYGLNERKGVNMINFSIKLGAAWDPAMSVEAVWRKTRDFQTKLG
jgi:hypothetical protein